MSDRPVLSAERKLELRELQLREAITRGAFNEARNTHLIAATNLSAKFSAETVKGFTLSPETLEYAPVPEAEETQPLKHFVTKK